MRATTLTTMLVGRSRRSSRLTPGALGRAAFLVSAVVGFAGWLGTPVPAAASSAPWQIVNSPSPSPGQTRLNSVTCVASNNCWAVGYATSLNDIPITLHWTGSSWSRVSAPAFTTSAVLQAVTCRGANNCWAVGDVDTHANARMLVEHWDGTIWSASVLPTLSDGTSPTLSAVSCGGSSDCWAVGYYLPNSQPSEWPLAVHWNGTAWSRVAAPVPDSLDIFWGVDCVSASYCLAVGEGSSDPLVERWNGSSWNAISVVQSQGQFDAVTCTASSACWAVGGFNTNGGASLVMRWNGSAFTRVTTPSAATNAVLKGVACVATNDCWSVGTSASAAPLAEHWNGSAWSSAGMSGASGDSFSVGCAGTSSCWAVGALYADSTGYNHSLIEHWNGGSWSRAASPNGGTQPAVLNSIACADASHCWAAGWRYAGATKWGNRAYVEQWNGSKWSIDSTPDVSGTPYDYLMGIACVTSTFCVAVGSSDGEVNPGYSDKTLIESWNGSAWRLVSSPNYTPSAYDNLYSVTCTSSTSCWAVGRVGTSKGDQPLIERWNGSAWSIVSPASGDATVGRLWSVSCSSSSNCWAVGDASFNAFFEHWDGSRWTVAGAPSLGSSSLVAQLQGVKCLSSANCWAVGFEQDTSNNANYGFTEHWDGSSWNIVAAATTSNYARLYGVDCRTTTECWAVGWTYDQPTDADHTLTERWNGSNWTIVSSTDVPLSGAIIYTAQPEGSMLNSVACVSTSDCRSAGLARGDDNIPVSLVEQDKNASAISSR